MYISFTVDGRLWFYMMGKADEWAIKEQLQYVLC